MHGHRYRIVAVFEGDLVTDEGVSDQGMVIDFEDMKRILFEKVHEPLDHGFAVWKNDMVVRDFLVAQKQRLVVMEEIPTAENLARWCFEQIAPEVRSRYGNTLHLKSVTVWETPNNSASYEPA